MTSTDSGHFFRYESMNTWAMLNAPKPGSILDIIGKSVGICCFGGAVHGGVPFKPQGYSSYFTAPFSLQNYQNYVRHTTITFSTFPVPFSFFFFHGTFFSFYLHSLLPYHGSIGSEWKRLILNIILENINGVICDTVEQTLEDKMTAIQGNLPEPCVFKGYDLKISHNSS